MSSPPADPIAPPEPEVILERGRTIDRFVVLGLVGRGGMGEVYAAYDPELDRKVAIKLLRAQGGSPDGRARLLREAQATAKLQHPNVIVVYDVGTFGESVFIAMEFVEGRTVSGWLHAAARTRREILEVYLAAGRGLVAAHAAGLVHRDFKPDNVMVTNDGQVRVMDFGLARQVGESDADGTTAPETGRAGAGGPSAALAAALEAPFDPDSTRDLGRSGAGDLAATSGKYLSVKLTQTGAMMGTPAYMAPEQFAVQPTDARTDQFSFCVALHEALYGKRPFEGESFLTLMTSVTMGTLSPPPPKAKVPAWMRKVLLRGLQTDPDRRHPSMSALLTALQTDPTVRARRAATTFVALAALVAGVAGFRRAGSAQRAVCGAAAERLAGVWDLGGASPRKEAIRRAFVATGMTFAEQAFTGAARYLDRFAAAWADTYRDACEATHVRGEQSAEVLDLRMTCLNARLVDLRALTNELAIANSKTVENAVPAATSLPGVDRCSDVRALRAVVKPPADEATRKRVEELREQKARLMAMHFAGKCDEGRKLESTLLGDTRKLGYGPLLAEVGGATCLLEDGCGGSVDFELGIASEGYLAALASGDDRSAAYIASLISGTTADRARNFDKAREWVAVGRALATRIGGDDEIEALLYQGEGLIWQYSGDVDKALAAFERQRVKIEKVLGKDHPHVGLALTGEGSTFQAAGRFEEALAVNHRAEAIFVKSSGPDHPWVAITANNSGEVLNALGRYPEARASFTKAIGIWSAQHSDPSIFAYGQTGLGLALLGEGRPLEASAPLEAALAARIQPKAPPELLGETRFALARALWAVPASRARALELARAARADYAHVESAGATVKKIDAWLTSPASRSRP